MRLRSGAIYGLFLLICFLVLDIAFGIATPEASETSFRIAHPYYHHGLRPNQDVATVWGDRHYAMRTNSLGFRAAAVATVDAKSPGRRVVLLGDSMIEGLGVEFPDTLAGQLAARGRSRGIEVLNAAVVSYSPRLYDLKTRWLVDHEKLAFDSLVVFIDISDVQDEVNYESFVPQWDPPWQTRGVAWWRSHSLSWRLVQRFLAPKGIDNRFRRDADIDVWMKSVDAYRNATSNPEVGRWEWTYDDAAFEAWGRKGLALAGSHMSDLAAFCREHGIALTIVVYPSPYQIFANERDGRQSRYWREFCDREKVAFVDLFPVFTDPVAFPGPDAVYERFFIADDVHWNEAGGAMLADHLEEPILGPRAPQAPRE